MPDQAVMSSYQTMIDEAFERRSEIAPATVDSGLPRALDEILLELNAGRLRVAEKIDGTWITHQWVKKAVLLYQDARQRDARRRALLVRQGAAALRRLYRGAVSARWIPRRSTGDGSRRRLHRPNVVLMPSYVNIGAYVGEGTMVDTWATVGSCAQIGKNVHLSGGAGIGGVLAAAGQPDDHRGQLLRRRAIGNRRRGHRRGERRDLDGRLHRPEHEDLRSRDPRGDLRPRARRIGRRRAICHRRTARIRSTVRSSSNASTRPRAQRRPSTSSCELTSAMTPTTDIQRETLDLAERLIACRSLTPDDGGALDMIAARLTRAGFACERIDRGPVRTCGHAAEARRLSSALPAMSTLCRRVRWIAGRATRSRQPGAMAACSGAVPRT